MQGEMKTTKQLSHTNSYTDMVDSTSKDMHNDRVVLVVAGGGIDAQRNENDHETRLLPSCRCSPPLENEKLGCIFQPSDDIPHVNWIDKGRGKHIIITGMQGKIHSLRNYLKII